MRGPAAGRPRWRPHLSSRPGDPDDPSRSVARRDLTGTAPSLDHHHAALRQGGFRGTAWRCHAVAERGGPAMSGLHDALTDYLATRRALGTQLKWPEPSLRKFVDYVETAGAE